MSSEVFDLADGLEIEQEEALSDDEVRERERISTSSNGSYALSFSLFLSLSLSPLRWRI